MLIYQVYIQTLCNHIVFQQDHLKCCQTIQARANSMILCRIELMTQGLTATEKCNYVCPSIQTISKQNCAFIAWTYIIHPQEDSAK